jgi:hypothetical protein
MFFKPYDNTSEVISLDNTEELFSGFQSIFAKFSTPPVPEKRRPGAAWCWLEKM